MRLFASFVPTALAAALGAQVGTNTVPDVGLTMVAASGPVASVTGQACGPFTCVPFTGPNVTVASSLVRTVRVHGDANSLWVLLLSVAPVAQPCQTIPGLGNALILGLPATTLALGVTGPYLPNTSAACRQGIGSYQLVLPNVSPAAIPFRLQALTYSFTTQAPAFTVAIQATLR